MNLIDIQGRYKDFLYCQLITTIDLFKMFDFYFNHLKNNTNG